MSSNCPNCGTDLTEYIRREREKVRETCASAVIGVSMAPSEMVNDRLMLAQDVRRRCMETIRQLDLTKLVARRRGKGAK